MKKWPLHIQIIVGLLIGLVWAIISSYLGWAQFNTHWISPFGTIFINLLKLIAVPLVLFSIIDGVSNLGDPKDLGRLGLKTIGLYLITTLVAVSTGLIFANVIKPARVVDQEVLTRNRIQYELWAKGEGSPFADETCLTCLPENEA